MYSGIDSKTYVLVTSFCTEAERLWLIERRNGRDSIMNAAAAEFLCLGYVGQGRDHAVLTYISEASEMGVRMGLFGVDDNDATSKTLKQAGVTDKAKSARRHAAWGVFNWITLSHSAHSFHQLHP